MINILIPTDFSDNARNAIRYALAYFHQASVNFYILHTSPETEDSSDDDFILTLRPPASTQAQKALQKDIDFAKETSECSAHRFIPINGNKPLVQIIRETIIEKNIDYIVMGTRGANKNGGQEEVGSNTYEVISKVKCPIIVVPEKARYKEFKNIALPTDFNNWDRKRMFNHLYETLLFKKAHLHILQIQGRDQSLTSLQEDTRDFLTDLFKEVDFEVHLLSNKSISQATQEYIDKLDIDMVIIVGRNINFIQRLFFRPRNKNINYRLETPFMILHD